MEGSSSADGILASSSRAPSSSTNALQVFKFEATLASLQISFTRKINFFEFESTAKFLDFILLNLFQKSCQVEVVPVGQETLLLTMFGMIDTIMFDYTFTLSKLNDRDALAYCFDNLTVPLLDVIELVRLKYVQLLGVVEWYKGELDMSNEIMKLHMNKQYLRKEQAEPKHVREALDLIKRVSDSASTTKSSSHFDLLSHFKDVPDRITEIQSFTPSLLDRLDTVVETRRQIVKSRPVLPIPPAAFFQNQPIVKGKPISNVVVKNEGGIQSTFTQSGPSRIDQATHRPAIVASHIDPSPTNTQAVDSSKIDADQLQERRRQREEAHQKSKEKAVKKKKLF